MLNNLSVGKAGSRRACACPRSRVVCVCVCRRVEGGHGGRGRFPVGTVTGR